MTETQNTLFHIFELIALHIQERAEMNNLFYIFICESFSTPAQLRAFRKFNRFLMQLPQYPSFPFFMEYIQPGQCQEYPKPFLWITLTVSLTLDSIKKLCFQFEQILSKSTANKLYYFHLLVNIVLCLINSKIYFFPRFNYRREHKFTERTKCD